MKKVFLFLILCFSMSLSGLASERMRERKRNHHKGLVKSTLKKLVPFLLLSSAESRSKGNNLVVHFKGDGKQFFNSRRGLHDLSEFLAEHGLEEVDTEHLGGGFHSFSLADSYNMTEVMASLQGHGAVSSVVEDISVKAHFFDEMTLLDPKLSKQWALGPDGDLETVSGSLHPEFFWDRGLYGQGVQTVVGDTGITGTVVDGELVSTHEDISPDRIYGGWDFTTDYEQDTDLGMDSDFSDPGEGFGTMECGTTNHGTHVLSIMAETHNNPYGGKGVAPLGSYYISRVLGECGRGSISGILKAIYQAAGESVDGVPTLDQPADFLSLSLGAEFACPTSWDEAFKALDLVIISSAGNDGINSNETFPASCSSVLTVGAIGPESEKTSYSNFQPGKKYFIWAPGGGTEKAEEMIHGAYGLDEYYWRYGTSQAVPHVTGSFMDACSFLKLRRGENCTLERMYKVFNQTEKRIDGQPVLDAKTWEGEFSHAQDQRASLILIIPAVLAVVLN